MVGSGPGEEKLLEELAREKAPGDWDRVFLVLIAPVAQPGAVGMYWDGSKEELSELLWQGWRPLGFVGVAVGETRGSVAGRLLDKHKGNREMERWLEAAAYQLKDHLFPHLPPAEGEARRKKTVPGTKAKLLFEEMREEMKRHGFHGCFLVLRLDHHGQYMVFNAAAPQAEAELKKTLRRGGEPIGFLAMTVSAKGLSPYFRLLGEHANGAGRWFLDSVLERELPKMAAGAYHAFLETSASKMVH